MCHICRILQGGSQNESKNYVISINIWYLTDKWQELWSIQMTLQSVTWCSLNKLSPRIQYILSSDDDLIHIQQPNQFYSQISYMESTHQLNSNSQ